MQRLPRRSFMGECRSPLRRSGPHDPGKLAVQIRHRHTNNWNVPLSRLRPGQKRFVLAVCVDGKHGQAGFSEGVTDVRRGGRLGGAPLRLATTMVRTGAMDCPFQ